MAQWQQIDSHSWIKLYFPYNRIEAELSEDEERFIRGENAAITLGGKLVKRPGTVALTTPALAGLRVDRLWVYETQDTPPKIYLIASCYNPLSGTWEVWFQERTSSTPAAWAQITSLRSINSSTRAHEGTASRGRFYIKGYPSAGSGEKLGTVVFDGSPATPTVHPWGLLGPQTPAKITGAVTSLNGEIDDVTTTLTVDDTSTFPASGTVVIDFEEITYSGKTGTTFTGCTRGANGTVAIGHIDRSIVLYRNFGTSDHLVQVNIGWLYSYAYKSITGQISNIAPVEDNPDLVPSFTGPFNNLIPSIVVQGDADTANIPTIVIYRTTDGGGQFFLLEEVTNTGAGDITYLDDSLESGTGGGTFMDPVPDAILDGGALSPTLTSNSPPPTVLAPEVVGVDTPIPSTPITTYAGRIWYAMGNTLFFSGLEEIYDGIPEECWPSGSRGNFFRVSYPIINLQETRDGLYVVTVQNTYRLSGINSETFNLSPLFENLGAPYGHPRAITRFGETVVLLTHDFRIVTINEDNYKYVSDPLFTDLVDQYNLSQTTMEFDIKYWGDLDKSWIFISGYDKSQPLNTKVWVYEINLSAKLNKDFWFVPWTVPATAMCSGRIEENSPQRRLVFYNWDATSTDGVFARIDPTIRTGTDYTVNPDTGLAANVGISFDVVTNLFTVPAGNHVNQLSKPQLAPCFYGFIVDRMVFAGDTEPNYYYFLDDFWSDPVEALYTSGPPRRPLSKVYKTTYINVNKVCTRASIEITKLASAELFEAQGIVLSFLPTSGA